MSCCGPRNSCDFDDDREGLSCADLERFGGDDITCPNCGSDVFHDAALCHTCGYAITDASLQRKTPAWVPVAAGIAAAGVALGAIYLVI